jgi:hypothetical protein
MSADKYSLFYCLTESGWQPIENEETRVEGWVEIYEVEVYQGSPFGRTSCQSRRLKTNPEFGAEDVKHLEQQFPMPDPLHISPEELKRILDGALSSWRNRENQRTSS